MENGNLENNLIYRIDEKRNKIEYYERNIADEGNFIEKRMGHEGERWSMSPTSDGKSAYLHWSRSPICGNDRGALSGSIYLQQCSTESERWLAQVRSGRAPKPRRFDKETCYRGELPMTRKPVFQLRVRFDGDFVWARTQLLSYQQPPAPPEKDFVERPKESREEFEEREERRARQTWEETRPPYDAWFPVFVGSKTSESLVTGEYSHPNPLDESERREVTLLSFGPNTVTVQHPKRQPATADRVLTQAPCVAAGVQPILLPSSGQPGD